MPRADYEQFIRIAPSLLPPNYALRDFSTDGKHYAYSFAKIDDKNTTAIEKSSSNFQYKGGLWLDIFPIDGSFRSPILQKIHYWIIRRLIKIRNKAYHFDQTQQMGIVHRVHLKLMQKMCKGKTFYLLISFFLKLKNIITPIM